MLNTPQARRTRTDRSSVASELRISRARQEIFFWRARLVVKYLAAAS
jgi:hypothetical protein